MMLVVTANWAIADGTVLGAPAPGMIRSFFRALRRAAWRTGFQRDGRYAPVPTIQIVLAGDTFDGLTSFAWHGDLRPWQGGPRVRAVAEHVAFKATRCGSRFLAGLVKLQRDGLAVPRADTRGRPMVSATCQAAVRVICLVGDRDRLLHDLWCTTVAGRYGIPVGTEWSSEAVTIRHGAECDPLCGIPDLHVMPDLLGQGRVPTLAESLAVDLLVDFARRLRGAGVPQAAAVAVTRRLAAARPFQMPQAIAECHEPVFRTMWQRSVQHWHAQAYATVPESVAPFDAVDALAAWMEAASIPDPAGPRPALVAATDSLRPRVPLHRSDPRLVVLGHAPARKDHDTRVESTCGLCLGLPQRQVEPPVAALVLPDAGSRQAGWLTKNTWELESPQTIHVAPSGMMFNEPGIVDAA